MDLSWSKLLTSNAQHSTEHTVPQFVTLLCHWFMDSHHLNVRYDFVFIWEIYTITFFICTLDNNVHSKNYLKKVISILLKEFVCFCLWTTECENIGNLQAKAKV